MAGHSPGCPGFRTARTHRNRSQGRHRCRSFRAHPRSPPVTGPADAIPTSRAPVVGNSARVLKTATLAPRLVLVLDGALHRVPFAALRVPGSPAALGLAHDLVQTPSAAYMTTGKKPRPVGTFPRSILAIADPVFTPGDSRVASEGRKLSTATTDLPRLPFTGELETINQILPASRRQILRGFDANPGTLRSLRLEDFAILHFSTHAVIDDQIPELSHIALSMVDRSGHPVNGFLRPYQLADLPLRNSVVVLSACDTALGKQVLGEGLMGFTGSLFHAGASQLVLTLTKVDAQASSLFFSSAYRRIFGREPVSVERALTLTRRSLAASERWSDPYYWASFVVLGKPSEVR